MTLLLSECAKKQSFTQATLTGFAIVSDGNGGYTFKITATEGNYAYGHTAFEFAPSTLTVGASLNMAIDNFSFVDEEQAVSTLQSILEWEVSSTQKGFIMIDSTDGHLLLRIAEQTPGASKSWNHTSDITVADTVQESSFAWVAGTSYRIKFLITYDGTNGVVKMWINDVVVINYEGDTKISGTDLSITKLNICCSGITNNTITFDNLIVTDTGNYGECPPKNGTLNFFLPAGNGAMNQWIGSDGDSIDNFELVDDNDSANFVQLPPSGTWFDLYTPNMTGTDMPIIQNLVISGNVSIENGDVLMAAIRDSSEQIYSMQITPDINGDFTVEFPINFGTGLPWTESDLTGLQFGIINQTQQ